MLSDTRQLVRILKRANVRRDGRIVRFEGVRSGSLPDTAAACVIGSPPNSKIDVSSAIIRVRVPEVTF